MKQLVQRLLREELSKHIRSDKVLPDFKWLKSQLRTSIWARLNKNQLQKIKAAYIVGSEAKGLAKDNSDIDIAIIMEPIKGVSSINFTQAFHDKYQSDNNKPSWNGRLIDFQFFWTTDEEWKQYDKIKIF